jgi:PAS domain S-box-containing protein
MGADFNNAQFRALLEAAPDAMVLVDAAGRVALVNRQAELLFGWSRDELVGQLVEVLLPARYRAAHPHQRAAYTAAPRARPMGTPGLGLWGLRKDGTEFSITAVRDLTDRRRVEAEQARLAQAEESLRMRDEFLSIASHELKTPLTTLKMQVDTILRLLDREPPVASTTARIAGKAEAIRRASDRLTVLVDQLLDLSRISGAGLALERERVDLAALARDVVAEFEEPVARAGGTIAVRADAPVVGVWDAARLEQIVTNLLTNALKYGLGRPVEIAVERDGATARLTVTDHGIGIASEHQGRIFDRFERVVSSRNYGGFGLGLWIVRKILDAHGGSIRVESAPGLGATFVVELPGCEAVPAQGA